MIRDEFKPLIDAFERDGFVNGGTVIGALELAELRADIERFGDAQIAGLVLGDNAPKLSEFGHDAAGNTKHYKIDGMAKVSPAFHRLVTNERMVAMVAALTNAKTLHLWADTVQYKPAILGGPVNWHQDGFYAVLFGKVGAVHRILSAWIALDDADEESGCMWMVPGSHRWGHRENYLSEFKYLIELDDLKRIAPPPGLDPAKWRAPQPCPVRAGEVHFHHAYTWHSSPKNRSSRPRRAYTVFYMADGVTRAPTDLELLFRAEDVA